jgi:hypothetical protein
MCTRYDVQQEQVWKYEWEKMMFNKWLLFEFDLRKWEKKELRGAGIKRQTYNFVRKQ